MWKSKSISNGHFEQENYKERQSSYGNGAHAIVQHVQRYTWEDLEELTNQFPNSCLDS